MSLKGLLVVKFPDKLIPEAVLKPLLSRKMNCAGFVVPTLIEGQPRLLVDKADLRETEIDVKKFQERQKAFEKQSMAFWLGELQDGFEAEDVQPFGISDKIAIFADGDFTSFAKSESSKPNSFFFVNQYIIPKLTKIFNECDQDVKKFMTTLQDDPVLAMEIETIAQGGLITVVSENNLYKTWPKGVNPNVQHGDWGWMSNKSVVIDNADKPVLQAPVETVKSGFGAFFKPKSTAEPAPAAAPEPPKTETAIPKEVPAGHAWMSPPAYMTSNSDIKDWYERRIKTRPEGWKDRVAVLIKLAELSDKEKAELKRQQSAKQPGPEQTEVIGKNAATGSGIVVTSTHIPAPETDQGYVKQKDINLLNADFVQTDKFVSDPTKAQAQEKDRQHFEDFKLGSLESFMRGADKAKLEHLAMYVEASVITMMDLRKALGWVGPKADQSKPEIITDADKKNIQSDTKSQPEPTPAPQTQTGFGSFFKPKKVA